MNRETNSFLNEANGYAVLAILLLNVYCVNDADLLLPSTVLLVLPCTGHTNAGCVRLNFGFPLLRQ
jgi:hypothetical protein